MGSRTAPWPGSAIRIPGAGRWPRSSKSPLYRELTELLEEQQPEGAIVATPNGTHLAVAEVCAGKGVDLLIEKPIADTLPAARSIVEVGAASGCRILVGHHRRHNPLIREARSQVQGGAWGG